MGYVLWKSCAVMLNVAAWIVIIAVLIGIVLPSWVGYLFIGIAVGLWLKQRKDRRAEEDAA